MIAAADAPGLLVVDDEADILQAVAEYLEDALGDVHVYTSLDARKGLEILDDERVALVVSDYRMPGMDGLSFLVEVHRRHPKMASIMMTAYAEPELKREATERAGVRLFLAKPIDLDYLTATIRDILHGHVE